MWNRVVLLVSGVAFGWSLVHWACAASARLRLHLYRWVAALAVGLAMIVWLWVSSAAAGIVAALVFAFSALVAYAANAQQANRPPDPEPLRSPEPPLEGQEGAALLLALEGPPARYDGPAFWAQEYIHRAARDAHVTHWFMRPWAYGRVRAAYQAAGGSHPLHDATAELLTNLSPLLPPLVHLGAIWMGSAPSLSAELLALGQRGVRRVVVVAVSADPSVEALRDLVARSRVRETGMRVDIAPLWAGAWPLPLGEASLAPLLRGQPPTPPAQPSAQQLAALAAELRRRLPSETT